MPAPLLLAPLLIKGFCALCAVGGTCYCVKKVADSYGKHSKRQKERLALKGKSLEEAREDNKKAREEEKKARDELEEQEKKIKELENDLEQAKNKLNDLSLSDEERVQWRRKIITLEDQLEDAKSNRKGILDKLKRIGERIKNNTGIISGIGLNTDDKHWIWDLITLENILIVAGIYVAYKVLKDDDKK